MRSPVLLEHLRAWWRFAHRQGLMLEDGWLFPGQNPVNPLTARQLNRVCKSAAADAEIDKQISMHVTPQFCRPSAGDGAVVFISGQGLFSISQKRPFLKSTEIHIKARRNQLYFWSRPDLAVNGLTMPTTTQAVGIVNCEE